MADRIYWSGDHRQLERRRHCLHERAAISAASFLACVLVGLVLWSDCGIAQEPSGISDECTGPILQPHPLQPFNFDTNSRLEARGQLPLYFDCVRNRHQDTELRVRWFVTALVDVWVPPQRALTDPRDFHGDTSNVSPFNSCLEYGGVGNTTTALFMNDKPESPEDAGRNPNCVRHAQEQPKPNYPDSRQAKLWALSYPLHLFFPSDENNPKDTMLELRGHMEIKPLSDTTYESFFGYSVARFSDRKEGDVRVVQVRPVFGADAGVLSAAFGRAYPRGYVPLSQADEDSANAKGLITFEVSGGSEWHMSSGIFRFIGRGEREVAAIRIPLFIPGP